MRYFSLLILFLSCSLFSQKRNYKKLDDLKYASCQDWRLASNKVKERCMFIELVKDGINYDQSSTKKIDFKVFSPEDAYQQIQKLFTSEQANSITCWTEYADHYIFALNCDPRMNGRCYYYCFLYIKKGGQEIWCYAPRT